MDFMIDDKRFTINNSKPSKEDIKLEKASDYRRCNVCGAENNVTELSLSTYKSALCEDCRFELINVLTSDMKISMSSDCDHADDFMKCPECGERLAGTYDINYDAKDGEDPRIYGVVCTECSYQNYD